MPAPVPRAGTTTVQSLYLAKAAVTPPPSSVLEPARLAQALRGRDRGGVSPRCNPRHRREGPSPDVACRARASNRGTRP